jgi:putative phosphoesterase
MGELASDHTIVIGTQNMQMAAPTMRIAVLSDIHGNLASLQAVWVDLELQAPDAVYCLGDLVGYGAHPNQVVEFIRQRELPTLMGNYDEGVGFDLDDCGCVYKDPELKRLGDLSMAWTRARTTQENKLYLQSLPLQIRLEDRRPRVLLVHGSPRRMNEYLYEDRPRATFERIAKLAGCDVLLFGHTHLPYEKRVAGTLFANVGSVGRSKDGDPRACYALVELGRRPRVVLRRVEYEVEAEAAAIEQSDLPDYYAAELRLGRAPAKATAGDHR